MVDIWQRNTRGPAAAGWRSAGLLPAVVLLVGAMAGLAGCTSDAQQGAVTPTVATPNVTTPAAPRPKTIPPFRLTVLAHGTELELAGGMPLGTTAAVISKLDAAPAIRVLHLNSDGGSILEGFRLEGVIKARGLITYTSTTCASACTVAFLAGKERYLSKDGWLGFHSTSDSWGGPASPLGNEAMRKIYQQEGLASSFIDKALGVDPRDVWYPTHQELITAHVIDAEVDESRFAQSGLAYWQTAGDVDAEMGQNDVFAALAAHDPANYAHIRTIFLDGTKSGRTIRALDDEAESYVVATLVPLYMSKAPDKQLLRYWRSQVGEFEFLQQDDPKACAAMGFPKLGLPAVDVDRVLPEQIKHEDMAAFADMILTSSDRPQPTADISMIRKALTQIADDGHRENRDVLRAFTNPADFINDPATLCGDTVFVFKKILDLPESDAAALVRAFMAKGSAAS